MNLIYLIKSYKRIILLAFSLVIIENVAWIVEPYIFGKVIDAVIDKHVLHKDKKILSDTTKTEIQKIQELSDYGQNLPEEYDSSKVQSLLDSVKTVINQNPEISILYPLLLWILAFVVNSGVGSLRRSLDPKIFLKIYNKVATSISRYSTSKKSSASKTTAKIQLSHEYINFMQYRAPEIIENIIYITGALLALYYFDWRISLTCFLIIFPLYFINKLYFKKVTPLQKQFHDEYERMYDVVSENDPVSAKNYFNVLAVPQKKIANWGAVNFASLRISLMIIFLVVLYVSIELDDFSAGELYSIVAYLWTFVTATEYLPELLENITSIHDISNRLKSESE